MFPWVSTTAYLTEVFRCVLAVCNRLEDAQNDYVIAFHDMKNSKINPVRRKEVARSSR